MPQDAPTNALAPALAAAEENGLFVDDPMPVSEAEIAALEAAAGAPMPASFRACLAQFGALQIDALEFYGLIPGKPDAGIPNILPVLQDMRAGEGLPIDLLPVENLGDGVMACLDLSAMSEGEAPVVEWDGGAPQRRDRVADCFGEYVLRRVESLLD